MLNHFGGRKKKGSTFSWSKIIPLLPPNLSTLVSTESLESTNQETASTQESSKSESENTLAINQENPNESKKISRRIFIYVNSFGVNIFKVKGRASSFNNPNC